MATGADGLFRPIYEGCISGFDSDVDRHPYHKNCGCALHTKKTTNRPCTHKFPRSNISYPIRRAWSDGSLAMAAASASASAHSSPSSSPAAATFSHDHDRHSNKLGVLFEI